MRDDYTLEEIAGRLSWKIISTPDDDEDWYIAKLFVEKMTTPNDVVVYTFTELKEYILKALLLKEEESMREISRQNRRLVGKGAQVYTCDKGNKGFEECHDNDRQYFENKRKR